MSGNTNFPTAVDDDASLIDVIDGTTTIVAAHHNNLKEAVKAIEAKIGIFNSAVPTSLDYRLGHPTGGHNHNNASGQGGTIAASSISGLASAMYDAVPPRHILPWYYQGSVPSGASLGAPMMVGRTMQIESVRAQMRLAPSGATAAFDVNFGPTSLWTASQLFRPIFQPGTSIYQNASPNLVTYPSGTLITVDADKVGTNEPGSDISIIFVFRE